MNENNRPEKQELRADDSFLGQPKGLALTSGMALSSGFVSYGMSAILIYYLYAPVVTGLGFSKINAAQFLNVFTLLNFMAGIVGAYIADRIFGIRKAMKIGYGLRTIGYILISIPNGGVPLYLASQIVLILASFSMGNSLYAIVGALYDKQDDRRDTGYSMMYIMNNVGAIAPLITGTLAQKFGYHAGFLAAAIVSGIAWIVYLLTENKVFGTIGLEPGDPIEEDRKVKSIIGIFSAFFGVVGIFVLLIVNNILTPSSFANGVSAVSIFVPFAYLLYIARSPKTSKKEAKGLIPFLVLFIANSFAMMVFYQSTTIMAIYAEQNVNLNVFGRSITPAAFQTLNAVFAVLFGAFASWLWNKMGDKQPNTVEKFGIGSVFYAISPLFMVIPFMLYPSDYLVSPMWLFVFYALMTWGEAMTSPIGFSAASKVAPKAFIAQMTTVWQLSQSTGSGLSALVANLYKEGKEIQYFIFIGTITLVVAIVILAMKKKLTRLLED